MYDTLFEQLYDVVKHGDQQGIFNNINMTPPKDVQNYFYEGVVLHSENHGRNAPFKMVQTAKSLARGDRAKVSDVVAIVAWHTTALTQQSIPWDNYEYMEADDLTVRHLNGWESGGKWALNVYNDMLIATQSFQQRSEVFAQQSAHNLVIKSQQTNKDYGQHLWGYLNPYANGYHQSNLAKFSQEPVTQKSNIENTPDIIALRSVYTRFAPYYAGQEISFALNGLQTSDFSKASNHFERAGSAFKQSSMMEESDLMDVWKKYSDQMQVK